jgi:hypothetical protein
MQGPVNSLISLVTNLITWSCQTPHVLSPFYLVPFVLRSFLHLNLYKLLYCLIVMAPNRSSRGKYNYTEKTLTSGSQCPHCGNMYKAQGFKRHESVCKQRDAEAKEAFNQEYERDQQKGES